MMDTLFLLTGGAVEYRQQSADDLMGSLEANSVQMVLTDPPYGVSYQSNRSIQKRKPISNDWNFQIGPFLQAAERILKEGGVCYLFTRWDIYPLWVRNLPPGLALKNFIVWNKDNHSSGDLTGNFGFKWEGIMMLVKGRHVLRGSRWSNVWDFPRVPFKQQRHPAEKPVALLRRAIEASSDPGDLVVDPFAGSGATGEAALLTGRNALLGDIDADYVRKGRERLGLTVEDLPAPTITRVVETDPTVCLDALEGLHPEEIRSVAEYLRNR